MAVRTNTRRRGIRTFALVWSLITIAMGACTFFAIYTVYGVVNPARNTITDTGSAALPVATSSQAAAIVPTTLAFPTRLPTSAAPTATEPPVEVAQVLTVEETDEPEPTEAPPSPTPLPVDERFFQVGTQVQVSPDLNP